MKKFLQANASLPRSVILMYHRVDNTDTDPWGICVSPVHFEEQVKFLKDNFNIISTHKLIKQVITGTLEDSSICITFDDGYADNYINAKPILEKYNCSATFFIPTAFINQTKPFWWDELERIFLHVKRLPGSLILQVNNNCYDYKLNESELSDKQWEQHKIWKWYDEPPTNRCAVFFNLWEKLKPLPYKELEKQMSAIRSWAETDNIVYQDRLPMNEQQLNNLFENNLFTIGLHTHSHPDLLGKEKQFQVEEISANKEILGKKFNINANCLAYPYGNFDNNTIKAVSDLKISGCFTTKAHSIYTGSDLTQLGRYQIFDCNIADFKKQLYNRFNNYEKNA